MSKLALLANYYLQVSCLLSTPEHERGAINHHLYSAIRLKNELKKVGVK